MGNALDRLDGYESSPSPSPPAAPHVEEILHPGPSSSSIFVKLKRRVSKRDDKSSTSPPLKVMKLDTAKYVYEKLFQNGEGSDITIHALGQVWNLHKFYLQQCKYFEALLNGGWKESKDNQIHLDVCDENVTVEGLHSVFGSLYYNEIEIDVKTIDGTLAAAFLIGLDSVINRCEMVMSENMSQNTVLRFYDISETYGLLEVQKKALECLKTTFWKYMKDRRVLKDLRENLLIGILESPEMLVAEGEMDLYRMLRAWIYMHENPDPQILEAEESEFEKVVSGFLRNSESGRLFRKYRQIFSSLRIQNCLVGTDNIKLIDTDNLIPKSIIDSINADQWRIMLKNEENTTENWMADISEEFFYANSMRVGRNIDAFPKYWRWTGYNFGIDLLLCINCSTLTMKRNCLNQNTPFSICLKSERNITYRLWLVDDNGHIVVDTGKKEVLLRLDQTVILTKVPDLLNLPFSIHLQYMSAEPVPQTSTYVQEYVNREI